MYLVAALSVCSSAIVNVTGNYFNKAVYSALYVIIVAKASAGKSIATWAIDLIKGIEQNLKERFVRELEAWKQGDQDETEKPFLKSIHIPANVSSAGFMQLLEWNKRGLIAETEIDTLSSTQSQEWGNYNHMLRAAFHHETLKLYRKVGKEYVYVQNPVLAVMLTGTFWQYANLFKSTENGLVTRFLAYGFSDNPEYISPFLKSENYEDRFAKFAQEVLDVYLATENIDNIEFKFTEQQMKKFDSKFQYEVNQTAENSDGGEEVGIIKRLGLIFFRITMILTVFRKRQFSSGEGLVCEDIDFEIAEKLIDCVKIHSLALASTLERSSSAGEDSNKDRLRAFNAMPDEFQTNDAITMGKQIRISERSMKRYLNYWVEKKLVEQPKKGWYSKIKPKD